MLEVNDFNAIHISLAGPEQVRGWSHGEVTNRSRTGCFLSASSAR
jgi:hypothetical protein